MTRTCYVALCEISCTPSMNLTSVSVYCDPQTEGVLMSCPLMETEIAPLCFGGIRIVFATGTQLIPDSMSSV